MKSPLQKISGAVARIERKLGYHKTAVNRQVADLEARIDILEGLFRRPE